MKKERFRNQQFLNEGDLEYLLFCDRTTLANSFLRRCIEKGRNNSTMNKGKKKRSVEKGRRSYYYLSRRPVSD